MQQTNDTPRTAGEQDRGGLEALRQRWERDSRTISRSEIGGLFDAITRLEARVRELETALVGLAGRRTDGTLCWCQTGADPDECDRLRALTDRGQNDG